MPCVTCPPVGIDRVAETRALGSSTGRPWSQPSTLHSISPNVLAHPAAHCWLDWGPRSVAGTHRSGEGEAFVGQEVDKLVHAGVGGLDCLSVPQAVIEGDLGCNEVKDAPLT